MREINTPRTGETTLYSYLFPLDRYDRPGGMYSLADLPICKVARKERYGTIRCAGTEEEDDAITHYSVQDDEQGFTVWVPADDIDIEPPG